MSRSISEVMSEGQAKSLEALPLYEKKMADRKSVV